MTDRIKLKVLDRREFVVGAGAGAVALSTLLTGIDTAEAKTTWQEVFNKFTGGAKAATDARVKLKLPEIAENGNTVPFTITVDSPMTDKDYVKSVQLIATGNPNPNIASFNFSPTSGKAEVSSRLRMGKTQDVVAVAQLSDGSFIMNKTNVKVTVGGCGG